MHRTRQTFPLHISLRFLSLEHLKSTVYVAEVNDVQHMQQRVLNALQIIHTTIGSFHRVRQSLSLFTSAAPVLTFSADTVSIIFNRPEVVTRKPCYRSPVFMKHFFLYCGAHSPSAGLAVHFLFILHMDETKAAIGLIQSAIVNTDHKL
jgi:hypothetical protein